MNLVSLALRRPISLLMAVTAAALLGFLALDRMARDIFPDLGVPVLYVAQPYGGLDPAQMEGFIVSYYEYHFLFITGIEHVESKSIQGVGLIKLQFHPGTNMAQAVAETVSYVDRARAFMPTETVPPFVMRFDGGSVPVGDLVFSSKTKTVAELPGRSALQGTPIVRNVAGCLGASAIRLKSADHHARHWGFVLRGRARRGAYRPYGATIPAGLAQRARCGLEHTIYLWSSGSEEAVLQVQLKPGTAIRIEDLKERLRQKLAQELPGVHFSFEPSDIASRVMSFGAPTPIEVAASGPNISNSRQYAEKLRGVLAQVPTLRDLAFKPELDYPTVKVTVNRERAGVLGVTANDVAKSVVAGTSSSRYTAPNYWADPTSGIGYQVQVEIPEQQMNSLEEVKNLPIARRTAQQIDLRNVASVTDSTALGEYDRYNMQRMLTLSAVASRVARLGEQRWKGRAAVCVRS
jgi:multidrug efflux pump subunit AcrB